MIFKVRFEPTGPEHVRLTFFCAHHEGGLFINCGTLLMRPAEFDAFREKTGEVLQFEQREGEQ
jgi:hypothetical protein